MTGSDITLYDPTAGEVIALVLRDAPEEQLADVKEAKIPALREQIDRAEEAIDGEWLRRLDRSGRWTRRVGEVEDGVQWIIRAPSPTAGATTIDEDALDETVVDLLADDEIEQEAADAALERTVTVVFRASSPEEVAELVEQYKATAGVVAVRDGRKVRAAGVRALLKIPAAAERIMAAGVIRDVDPPRRRPKVERIDARRAA